MSKKTSTSRVTIEETIFSVLKANGGGMSYGALTRATKIASNKHYDLCMADMAILRLVQDGRLKFGVPIGTVILAE